MIRHLFPYHDMMKSKVSSIAASANVKTLASRHAVVIQYSDPPEAYDVSLQRPDSRVGAESSRRKDRKPLLPWRSSSSERAKACRKSERGVQQMFSVAVRTTITQSLQSAKARAELLFLANLLGADSYF